VIASLKAWLGGVNDFKLQFMFHHSSIMVCELDTRQLESKESLNIWQEADKFTNENEVGLLI